MLSTRQFAVSAAAALIFAGAAAAQITSGSYSVTHNFTFSTPFNIAPIATFNGWAQAGAFEPAPGWDIRGFAVNGWGIGQGGFNLQTQAGTDRPTPGYNDAGATAGIAATVNNWGFGNVWSAQTRAYGSAHAQFFPNQAFAVSTLSTRIFTPGWINGQLQWRPIINDVVGGGVWVQGTRRPFRRTDPIHLQLIDSAGSTLLDDTLFDIDLESNNGMQWNEDGLSMGANPDLRFTMSRRTNQFVTGASGDWTFEVINGVVTQSDRTGLFVPLDLPNVGDNLSTGFNLSQLSTVNSPLFSDFNFNFTSLGQSVTPVWDLGGNGSLFIPTPGAAGVLVLAGFVAARRRRN